MLSVLMLVVVGLATWQAVEIYRHSPLFEDLRDVLADDTGLPGILSSCGWCLSVWVAGAMYLFWILGLTIIPFLFAASRIANIFHDAYSYAEEQNQNWREDRDRNLSHAQELHELHLRAYRRPNITLNNDDDVRKDIS
jgi:hypothetical protein